jgi:hypothetical protein
MDSPDNDETMSICEPVIDEIIHNPENTDFEAKKKSTVYSHFILDRENNKYNCKYCNKSYKISKDGSTSSLWKHVKTKHEEIFLEINQITNALNKLEISEVLVYIYVLFYIV